MNIHIFGRCTTPDPYLILGSRYPAILYKGLYYFQPGWLNQTSTDQKKQSTKKGWRKLQN
ncbi:MAG: hypothetical protein K5907_07615 [Treponema sp.]|nr:hypothetical protein [Treponema sp.]